MESSFYEIITNLYVPFILLIYFLFSVLMVVMAPPGRVDVQGPARVIAFLLSLTSFLLLAAVLHSYSSVTRPHHFLIPIESVALAILGIGLGVIFCLVAYLLVSLNLVQFLVLFMTTMSLMWFYFFFIESWMREIVVVLAIGQLLGILCCALVFAQQLDVTGLVWICNRCGTHHFFSTAACRCGQTQMASQAANRPGGGGPPPPPPPGSGSPLGGPGPQPGPQATQPAGGRGRPPGQPGTR